MSTSFANRFFVQLRTDLKLLAWPALLTWVVMAVQLSARTPVEELSKDLRTMQHVTSTPIEWLSRLLPLALVFIILRADALSNSNTASLTRPIGGGAMWCSKLAALTLMLSIPWLLCDLYVASISPHSISGWLTIIVSSLGNTLFLIGFSAALASITSNRRQLILMATVIGVLWIFGYEWIALLISPTALSREDAATTKSCAVMAAYAVAFVGIFTCWWLATVKRRHQLAVSALTGGVTLAVVTSITWPFDWLARTTRQLESHLTLQLGHPDAATSPATQPLWPTLRVAGLAKGEVCSVLALAPIIKSQPWPGEQHFTDFEPKDSNPSRIHWVTNEHVRALIHHFPATDLWPLAYTYHEPSRPEIGQLISRRDQNWRLRLAVHRMKKVGELPLLTVWNQPCEIPLHEGVALRLGPVRDHGEHSATTLNCGLHEMHSSLMPLHDPASIPLLKRSSSYGFTMPFNFVLIAHDPESRENTFDFADMADYWGGHDSSWGLLVDRTDYRGMVLLHPPKARIALGFTTEERWRQTTTVQVWVAEEKGTVDLDLTQEQIEKVMGNTSPVR